MAEDFAAEDLLEHAEARFGAEKLRNRMRGAVLEGGEDGEDQAEAELLKIADSVVSRVRAATSASVGWPLPGTSEAGVAFREIWPPDLLQRALDLFNWRTLSGSEEVTEDQRRVGAMAEKYFNEVQNGTIGLGIGGDTDVTLPVPISARARTGEALITGLADRGNFYGAFSGRGWDQA